MIWSVENDLTQDLADTSTKTLIEDIGNSGVLPKKTDALWDLKPWTMWQTACLSQSATATQKWTCQQVHCVFKWKRGKRKNTTEVYLMKGRTPVSGELFGFPVSDLLPRSTRVFSLQLLTPFRVGIQQQFKSLGKRQIELQVQVKQQICWRWEFIENMLTSVQMVCHSQQFLFPLFPFHTIGCCRWEHCYCCQSQFSALRWWSHSSLWSRTSSD